MRLEAIKVLEENIGGVLLAIGLGDDFWDLTPNAKINNMNPTQKLHR